MAEREVAEAEAMACPVVFRVEEPVGILPVVAHLVELVVGAARVVQVDVGYSGARGEQEEGDSTHGQRRVEPRTRRNNVSERPE